MKQNEFAALWRQKMEQTIEREFDGMRGVFRRVSLNEWMRRGKVPQFYIDEIMDIKGVKRTDTKAEKEELTDEDLRAYHDFRRDFVIAAVVQPKLVAEDRELKEDEISYADFAERCEAIVEQIFRWTLKGSPDIPVETKGGETSIDEIATFREGGEDKPAPIPGNDVQADQPNA